MEQQNIIIISNTHSYLSTSIQEKLSQQGYNAKEIALDINALHDIKEDVSAMFIYADDDIGENNKALVFLKDKSLENDIPIFAAGRPEELEAINNVIPKHMLVKTFARPINVGEVSDAIQEYIQAEGNHRKKKILVVDDSGAMLRNVKGWLEGKYHVTLANSAASAMKCISLKKPDLILLDYEMPVVDGKQVLEMIRTEVEFERLPVIFLTGKDDKESIMKVMALKPNGYLLKNQPPKEIIAAVDAFFDKQKAEM